jgi:hypothetical protein
MKDMNDKFGSEGFLLSRNLFPIKEIDVLCEFLEIRRKRLSSQFEEYTGKKYLDESTEYPQAQKRIKEFEERGLPKDLRHYLTGEFDLETRLDERIVALFSFEHCFNFITKLFNSPDFFIHYPPMLRFKMGGAQGSTLPPHQDRPYSPHLSNFFTVWVPLVDITEDVGGVVAYRGSHNSENLNHSSNNYWAHGIAENSICYDMDHVLMKKGDALLFPSNFIHSSAPQRSVDKIRYSIDFRIILNRQDTTKSYFHAREKRVYRLH